LTYHISHMTELPFVLHSTCTRVYREDILLHSNNNTNLTLTHMHTYTHTHRVEEEDDRMLATKQESLEMKKYDPFASSVVSDGGSLDISKLVDPHGPSGMAFSHDQTSFDSSPIGTPSPLVQHESKDPSPPSEQVTPTSDLVPSPSQSGEQVQQVSHSPGRQPPPPLVSRPHSQFHGTTAATRRDVSHDYKPSS